MREKCDIQCRQYFRDAEKARLAHTPGAVTSPTPPWTRIKQIECWQKELKDLAKANELANLVQCKEDIKGLKEGAKNEKEDILTASLTSQTLEVKVHGKER